jgi:DNA modification methylase
MEEIVIPAAYMNQIVTGDARILAERIPDASVDLLFTDPVYDRIDDYAWLAETAARVLKPDRACLAFSSIGQLGETIAAMRAALAYRWQFIEYRTNEVKHRHAPGGKCVYVPLLWFDKGNRRPAFVLDVRAVAVHTTASNHRWSKPPLTIRYYMHAFTQPGMVIFDPFCGGGTMPAAAIGLGLEYIAFERDPAAAERARARVDATQAIHPIFLEEQHAMELNA